MLAEEPEGALNREQPDPGWKLPDLVRTGWNWTVMDQEGGGTAEAERRQQPLPGPPS